VFVQVSEKYEEVVKYLMDPPPPSPLTPSMHLYFEATVCVCAGHREG